MALFSKLLTEDDVEKRLEIPKEWMTALPPIEGLGQEVDLRLVDGSGGLFWEFHIVAVERFTVTGLRSWSVFAKADNWLRFVRYRDLRVGDRITLQLQENKFRGTKYVMGAQRRRGDDQGRSYWIDLF